MKARRDSKPGISVRFPACVPRSCRRRSLHKAWCGRSRKPVPRRQLCGRELQTLVNNSASAVALLDVSRTSASLNTAAISVLNSAASGVESRSFSTACRRLFRRLPLWPRAPANVGPELAENLPVWFVWDTGEMLAQKLLALPFGEEAFHARGHPLPPAASNALARLESNGGSFAAAGRAAGRFFRGVYLPYAAQLQIAAAPQAGSSLRNASANARQDRNWIAVEPPVLTGGRGIVLPCIAARAACSCFSVDKAGYSPCRARRCPPQTSVVFEDASSLVIRYCQIARDRLGMSWQVRLRRHSLDGGFPASRRSRPASRVCPETPRSRGTTGGA